MAKLPYEATLKTAVYLALTSPPGRGHPSPEKPLIEFLRSNLPIDAEFRGMLADLLERGGRSTKDDDVSIMLKFHNHGGKNSVPAKARTIERWLEIWLAYKLLKGVKGGAMAACAEKFRVSEDHIKQEVKPVGRIFDEWIAAHDHFASVWPKNEEHRIPNAVALFSRLYADKKTRKQLMA